jgi:branched-chain amino acid transport system permease protein
VGIQFGQTLQFGGALGRRRRHSGRLHDRSHHFLLPGFMVTVLMIYSFAAASRGGFDSLGGVVVGGILVGLVETMLGGYIDVISSELARATVLGVIVVVQVARPNGLLGSQRVEHV